MNLHSYRYTWHLKPSLLAALAPKAVQKCHWGRTFELDHWNCVCSCSLWIHPLALSLTWIAYQAICTQDNPDGKLRAASYYFIITASIMTGPERLIAAGEVNGQGTQKENKDEAWHMWLWKRCSWLSLALVRVLITKMKQRVSS